MHCHEWATIIETKIIPPPIKRELPGDQCIIPVLQPLLYIYIGTSTYDKDRDRDHELDHNPWAFFWSFNSNLLPMLQLRLQKSLWSVRLLQFPHRVLLYMWFNTRPGSRYLLYDMIHTTWYRSWTHTYLARWAKLVPSRDYNLTYFHLKNTK